MSERIETLAVVARMVDYGEADRVVTLLTEQRGRVSAMARNARRSRRRFGGALSLFVVGQATLQQRRRSELLLLEGFRCCEDLAPAISSDVVKVAHGSYLLELTREIWPADAPDRRLFDLACEGLRALAGHPPNPALLRAFELQLLAVAGLAPSLQHCVRCGAAATASPMGFSVSAGGVICQGCGPHGWPFSAALQRQLLDLLEMPLAPAAETTISRETAHQARELLWMLVRHHLGKELRTLAFIAQLAGYPRLPDGGELDR